MEAYFVATGAMHWLKLFEANMQSQVFTLNGVSPDGTNFAQKFQGMLQPIQLYRYVFPKEAAPIVLKTLQAERAEMPNNLNFQAWALRKALGLEKPDIQKLTGTGNLPNVKLPIVDDHLQIAFIGVKEDPTRVFSETGVKQEAI